MMKTNYKGTRDEARAMNAYVKLVRAAESVSARIHQHIFRAGFTISQFGILEALYHLGPLTQAALAQKILKSSGNITMVIDNLEKQGLVKRGHHPEDRRSYAVDLTAKGKKTISSLFPVHAAGIVKDLSILSKSEQETLGNLCRKLGRQQGGSDTQ